MSLIGADVGALRGLAATYDAKAAVLESMCSVIDAQLAVSTWEGPVADEFRGDWASKLGPDLVAAAGSFADAAKRVRDNADAQQIVSDDTGVGAAGGAGPSSGNPPATGSGTGESGGSQSGGAVPTGDGATSPEASGPTVKVKDKTKSESFNGPTKDESDRGTSGSASAGLSYDPETGQWTGTGSVSLQDWVKTTGGSKVSFGVSADTALTTGVKTKDGFTTYTNKADVSVGISGGISKGGYGIEGAAKWGLTSECTIKLPEGTAAGLGTVNPFDPATMPPGSSVTMKSGDYTGTELEATFKHIALKSGHKESAGMSSVVEKLDDNIVRITAGPTAGIENQFGIGLKVEDFKASLGATHGLESGTYRSAELDLSTPEGLAAYNEYLVTGELPQRPSTGISGTTEIFSFDYDYSLKAGISTPWFDATSEINSQSQSVMATTHPDGTMDQTMTFEYPDRGDTVISQSFDANGKEDVSARMYTYLITPDKAAVQFLNQGDASGLSAGQVVKPGQTVQLTLTEGQVEQLRDGAYEVGTQPLAHMSHAASMAVDSYNKPVDTLQFGHSLSHVPRNDFELLYDLYNIGMGPSKDPSAPVAEFPGTITVLK